MNSTEEQLRSQLERLEARIELLRLNASNVFAACEEELHATKVKLAAVEEALKGEQAHVALLKVTAGQLATAESERDLLRANEDTFLGEAKQTAKIIIALRAKLAAAETQNELLRQLVSDALSDDDTEWDRQAVTALAQQQQANG